MRVSYNENILKQSPDQTEAEQALDTAIALVRRNLPLYTDHCQNHSSVHDIYPQCENNQWTCGFWPVSLAEL